MVVTACAEHYLCSGLGGRRDEAAGCSHVPGREGCGRASLRGAMPFSDGFWRRDFESSLPVPGLCSFPQGLAPAVACFRVCPAQSRARATPTATPTMPAACGAYGCGSGIAESSSSFRMSSESGGVAAVVWAGCPMVAAGSGAASSPSRGLGRLCPSAGARPGMGSGWLSPAAPAGTRARRWHSLRCRQTLLSLRRLEGSRCQYDAIEVYDGGSPGGPLLGTVCRNDHRVFISSGHQLTILFRSDSIVAQRGFQAYYYSFLASSSTTGKTRAVLYPLPGQKH